MDKDPEAKDVQICYKQIQKGFFFSPSEATSYHLTLQFLYKCCSDLWLSIRCHENSHVFEKDIISRYDILLSNSLVPRSMDLGGNEKQNWNRVKDWGQESSSTGWSSLAKCGPWVSNEGSQGPTTKIRKVVPSCEKVS